MKITEQSISLISNLLLYEYKQFLHFLYMSIKFHLINDRVKPANNSLDLTKLKKILNPYTLPSIFQYLK